MQENMGAGDSKRQRQVSKEMEHLEKASEELMAMIDETENRLCDILADSKPTTPDDDSKKAELSVVSLASNIRAVRNKIMSQSNRLRNMLARLEL